MSQYRAIRGMVDILPDDTPLWQMLEQTASDVLGAHGYQEIRTPIVESTDLFARSIGEVTDIVEKEMYSFPDRTCSRSEASKSKLRPKPQPTGKLLLGVRPVWVVAILAAMSWCAVRIVAARLWPCAGDPPVTGVLEPAGAI